MNRFFRNKYFPLVAQLLMLAAFVLLVINAVGIGNLSDKMDYLKILRNTNLSNLTVWAYCLIPNHFHFLIKVKSEEELTKLLRPEQGAITEMISNQFRILFISYTKSFNKVYTRNGSLFQKPFKHILVDSQSYLFALIHYIHHNPIHHNFTDTFNDWTYSSYLALIGNGSTKVDRNSVLDLFGDKNEFMAFHNQMKDYKKIQHLLIE